MRSLIAILAATTFASAATLPHLDPLDSPIDLDTRGVSDYGTCPKSYLYAASNNANGNVIIGFPIAADGTVSLGSRTPTGGKGSRARAASGLPDALDSQSSLQVAGNYLFVVNAGSNTVSAFTINQTDPSKLKPLGPPADTLGDFPNSLAVSLKLKTVCVLNAGARTGVACLAITSTGLKPVGALRPLTNSPKQSTPPLGPTNTVSQLSFTPDHTGLIVTVKGNPSIHNNGYIAYYPISSKGSISTTAIESSPKNTTALFGFHPLANSSNIFATDAAAGIALIHLDPASHKATTLANYTIPHQVATCWTAQSKKTGYFYTADDGYPQILAFDPFTAKRVGLTPPLFGIPNMIEIISHGEHLYALSHGNRTFGPHVLVLEPLGGNGANGPAVKGVQSFAVEVEGVDFNVDGLAAWPVVG